MPQPKLLEKYRECLRVKRYGLRTEDTYLHWARRSIDFHGKRRPHDMDGPEVEAFLSHLATEARPSQGVFELDIERAPRRGGRLGIVVAAEGPTLFERVFDDLGLRARAAGRPVVQLIACSLS